jgi:hypothetical protein
LRHEIIKQHSKQRLVAFFSFELSNIPLCGFLHNYGLLFKTASRFCFAFGSAQPPRPQQNE